MPGLCDLQVYIELKYYYADSVRNVVDNLF